MTLPAWLTWNLVRRLLPYIGIALALLALWRWHDGKVEAAFEAGAVKQAAADLKAIERAEKAATARQAAIIAARVKSATAINERTTDALEKRNAALARSYDDLRMRWAAYRANQGGPGNSDATAVSGSPASVACAPAAGFVPVETAIAPSEAADRYAAQLNGWIDWYEANKAAWPK